MWLRQIAQLSTSISHAHNATAFHFRISNFGFFFDELVLDFFDCCSFLDSFSSLFPLDAIASVKLDFGSIKNFDSWKHELLRWFRHCLDINVYYGLDSSNHRSSHSLEKVSTEQGILILFDSPLLYTML